MESRSAAEWMGASCERADIRRSQGCVCLLCAARDVRLGQVGIRARGHAPKSWACTSQRRRASSGCMRIIGPTLPPPRRSRATTSRWSQPQSAAAPAKSNATSSPPAAWDCREGSGARPPAPPSGNVAPAVRRLSALSQGLREAVGIAPLVCAFPCCLTSSSHIRSPRAEMSTGQGEHAARNRSQLRHR